MMVRVYERYSARLEWLHGFYALSAYSQLDLTGSLDGVSVGWAKLELNELGQPYINDQKVNSNDWVKPEGAGEVLDHLAAAGVPCNLNIYGSDVNLLSTPEARTASVQAMVSAAVVWVLARLSFSGDFLHPAARTATQRASAHGITALWERFPGNGFIISVSSLFFIWFYLCGTWPEGSR